MGVQSCPRIELDGEVTDLLLTGSQVPKLLGEDEHAKISTGQTQVNV